MAAKVLIADDEAHIRLLLRQTLEDIEDQGVTILRAANGMDALQMIYDEKPDLVFLDIMMPKMNGFEVCQRAKAEYNDAIYIALLTAKGQEVDRRLGEQAGANCYITKPFDPDELLALAKSILKL